MLRPAGEDLAARRPVWEALAEMFLDSDPALSRQWRAERLAGSPYSLHQLEHILMDEVSPVCRYNLMSVAGEWAGFDAEWLEARILRRLDSPLRFLHRMAPRRLAPDLREEWHATRDAIVTARDAGTSG